MLMLAICILSSCGGGENPGTNQNPECTHSGGSATCATLAVCETCGKSYGTFNPDVHEFSAGWVSAGGYHYHICKNGCDATSTKERCDITPTCTSMGSCSVCGVKGKELDPDNHKPKAEWTTKDGYHYHACEYGCDAQIDRASCESEGTCQTPLPCEVCGVDYIRPENHSISDTFTVEGGIHYKTCNNGCGTKFEVGECDITPTCVSAGECSVCGTKGTAPDPSAHAPSENWITEGGSHYRNCENGCGIRLDEGVCDITPNCVSAGKCSSCGAEGDAIDPDNHKYSEDYVITDTRHYKTCENGCGLTLSEGNHSFSEWSNDKVSTTAERGMLSRSCSVCLHKETMESPASIMKVKGGASSIFVLIHDDGTWNTVAIADKLYKKYGLVGDAAITLRTAFMSTGVKTDFTDDKASNMDVLKWRTLFDTNRWKLISHSMTHSWWGTYDKTTADGKTVCENLERSEQLEWYEIVKSQALLRYYFPGQRVLTFAHPGFAEPKNYIPGVTTGLQKYDAVYNEEARILMDKYYIAARGTLNALININDPQGSWEKDSSTSGYASKTYSDVWNYVPSYCVDDTNLEKTYIQAANNAAANGQMAVFFIHKLTKNESEKDNSNTMYAGNYEIFLQTIAAHVKSGTAWNAFFEDAVMYLHEAASAKASVRLSDNAIYVTLTDEASQFMLDENGNSTGEEIYTYPLTVRVDVPESWKAIKYEQGGKVGYAAAKLVDGKWVADAEIVPDMEEAKISEAQLSDIPKPEEAKPVVGTEVLEYDTSYDFENGTGDVFASLPESSGAATSKETVGTDNWLKMTKTEGYGNPTWTLYGGYLPTQATHMSVSFNLHINEAILKTGRYDTITDNKRVMNISFADDYNSPYGLVIYRAISDSADGASGKLYLADCSSSKYAVIEGNCSATDNYIMELSYDTDYEIRVDMQMDGVNPFLAVIYVNGVKVKESKFAMSYQLGAIPTVQYVKFCGQARGAFDILVDDVTMKTTAPTGKATVSVYEQDFDSKNASITKGGNTTIEPIYSSPDASSDRVALNINKPTSVNQTQIYTMNGSSVSNATAFTFKFDVYVASGAQPQSGCIYQIYFNGTSASPYVLTIEGNGIEGFVLKDRANSSSVGNQATLSKTLAYDTWHSVELVVNLDGDFGALAYVDGSTNGVVSTNYSRTNDGDTVRTTLNRVALYAQKASGANVYFDNFKLTAEVSFE